MKNLFKKLFGKDTTGKRLKEVCNKYQAIEPDIEEGIAKLFCIVVDGKPVDGIGSRSLMEARANHIRAKLYIQGGRHNVHVVVL